MHTTQSYRTLIIGLLKVSLPLIAVNLGFAGITFADTVMAGRYSSTHLAAVAVASAVWYCIAFTLLGLFMALSPITGQQVGAKKLETVKHYFQQAVWLAVLLALCLIVLVQWYASTWLSWVNVEPAVRRLAAQYLQWIVWSSLFLLPSFCLRFVCEGLGNTRIVLQLAVITLIINVIGNYLLVYGHWGLPELGALGCAVASVIAIASSTIVFVWLAARLPEIKSLNLWQGLPRPGFQLKYLRSFVAIGLPIAVSIFAEIGFFNIVVLLISPLGTTAISAHQIALNYAGTLFMIPLGVSLGTTIMVSQHLGAGNRRAARQTGWLGIGLSAAIMSVSAISVMLLRQPIAALYSNDPDVITLVLSLMGVAAMFQLFDGIQVAANGALRGYKDTTIPSIISVFCYWAVGFSFVYLMGIQRYASLMWVWYGFALSLTIASVMLISRFVITSRKA